MRGYIIHSHEKELKVERMAGAACVRSVHLNTERGFRGGEIQTLGLVRHLASQGQPTTLLAPPHSELALRAEKASLDVLPFRAFGEWDLMAAFQLRGILRQRQTEIVHAHTPHALALALLARGRKSKPLVVGTRRVSFPLRGGSSALKYSRADAIVAVSRSIGQSLQTSGIAPARIRVIHSGVDLDRFARLPSKAEARKLYNISPECPLVGIVSALAHHKGLGVFMRSFHRVWMEIPPVQAVVAGAGELLDPLRNAAQVQNLPVRFLGFLPEPAELLPALDVLVLPSISGEGSPGIVKEAAAAGIPVVATDVGGTTEILRPDMEAIIVPAGDPEALADALIRVLSKSDLSHTLGRAARERIRCFSMEAMAGSTLELYRELLDGKSGSR